MAGPSGEDPSRRGRALIILATLVVVLGLIVWGLWRALVATTYGVDLDEQLARFPVPAALSAVGGDRSDVEGRFLGKRPARERVFVSAVGPEPTCDLLWAALEEYAVDATLVPSRDEVEDTWRPSASCIFAGPLDVGSSRRRPVHARASVHTPEHYDRLAEVGAVPSDVETGRAPAVVVLRLQG